MVTGIPGAHRRVYIFLAVSVALFHRGVLFVPGVIFPWDFSGHHVPHAVFLSESLHRGELPLWDPSVYCGRPFAANIQTQSLYPPRLVSSFVGGFFGVKGVSYALELEEIVHIYVAGLFCFWLALRLGMGEYPAALAAVVYCCGCYFASQAEHVGAIETACWLPLAWLGVVLVGDAPRRGFAALTLALTAAVLCGFTPMAAIVYLSVMVLAAAWNPRAAIRVSLAMVCSLLLAGIQLLPAIQLMNESVARWRSDWRGTGGGIPPASFLTLLRPDYFNVFDLTRFVYPADPTFLYLYCGASAAVLALAGVLSMRNRRGFVFAILGGLSALLMCGDRTQAGLRLFQALPAVARNVYYAHHWLAPFSLALALAAGFGLERVARRPSVAMAVLLCAAADVILVSSGRPFNTVRIGGDSIVYGKAVLALDRIREIARRQYPASRLDTVDDSLEWPQASPITGIPSASGYDPMALIRIMQVRLGFARGERWGAYYQVENPGSPLTGLMNVELLLARKELPASAGLAPAGAFPGRFLYRNPRVQPRFFLISNVTPAGDLDEAVRRIRSPGWEPRVNAVVEISGSIQLPPFPGGSSGRIAVLSYRARRVELQTETSGAQLLVASDANYPGWRAFIDGARVPIFYTDVAFRGVAVPAGRHTVILRFEPDIFWYGAGFTLIGLCALLPASLRWGNRRAVGRRCDPPELGTKYRVHVVPSYCRNEVTGCAPTTFAPNIER